MASKRENLLDWVKQYTGNNGLTDSGGISIILDRLEKHEESDPTIAQKSVSRYSVSYKKGLPTDILDMLKTYKRVRFF